MSTRSTTFVIAVALVGATGAAFAIGGLLLVWLASGRAALLLSPGAPGVLVLTAAMSIAVAVAAWIAAVDLWHGRARGWAGALGVAVVAVAAAAGALAEGGLQPPLVVGAALTLATFVSLLAAAPRQQASVRASGAS